MKTGARAIGVGFLVVFALVGFAAAFGIAASAGAGTGPGQSTEPPPETTVPPPSDPPPTEPEPPEPTPSPRRPTIQHGVTIGGIDVGGLLPYEASALVREQFARPLVLQVGDVRRVSVTPRELRARANVAKAVGRAQFARADARVPLDVSVPKPRVSRWVEQLGRELDRAPVDARMVLKGTTIRTIPALEGRRLQRLASTFAIRFALRTHERGPLFIPFSQVEPKVTERSLGPAIVIMRGSNRLRFFDRGRLVRTFGVATGQASFPTPVGSFEIVNLQRNPWWYPPPSDWAAGEEPVPPGPGNPLGTRWMGISAPYVGIHGTPDAASIGYSASHGCIRMRISEAEWLFQRVEIGTPVFIVPG